MPCAALFHGPFGYDMSMMFMITIPPTHSDKGDHADQHAKIPWSPGGSVEDRSDVNMPKLSRWLRLEPAGAF